ncbi:3-oxoacyl-[acyl-carrier-protein] synthase III C-terminal domain-containing protein [Streptomyces mirabilis]|uniref:3-oxoacyl-[acyl-carrier-protein] synthase III C-terminal domain-containing protein n=1 Tax=Streptomyces mirabilis TaxID=68239 RepID=UPI0033EC6133
MDTQTKQWPKEQDTDPNAPGLLCVHQPSVPFVHEFCARLGVRADIVVPTFHRTANMGAATLPLQHSLAAEQGRLRPGDTVARFGLASGASATVMLINWSAPTASPHQMTSISPEQGPVAPKELRYVEPTPARAAHELGRVVASYGIRRFSAGLR